MKTQCYTSLYSRKRQHPWRQAVLLVALVLVNISLYAQTTKRVYFVGNSVTDAINYGGLDALAESRGNTHIWGRQMIPGAPLQWLWDHPSDGFTEQPFGYPTNAFPNYTWDAISLQPFDRLLEGTGGDLDIIGRYIDLADGNNPDVQIYIYSRWPRSPYGDDPNDSRLTASLWNQLWDRTYTGGWDGTAESRDYFVDLTQAVRATHTSVDPALMVPVGQVFQSLNNKMAAGQVPGFSSIWKVYSDGIHLNGTGSYIAAVTYFTTLYGENPVGLGVPVQFGTISPEVAQVIQQTVWDVVTNEPLSGVTGGGGPGPGLRNPENPANAVSGLDYSYYEGTWSTLPDFTALTSAEDGTVSTFDLAPRNRNDNFGFRYSGYIDVPTDGTYTFYTSSDDGSKLYIGTTTVVNNDGLHAAQEQSGTIGLKAGKHAISVTFFEANGGEVLTASYSGPGISKQAIPASALFRVPQTGTENNPPTAVLTATPESGTAPLNVTFSAAGSSDPDAGDFILGYDWNFGDNTTSNANAPNHTYTTPGTYTVSLRVMDNRNLYSAPVTKNIVVLEPSQGSTTALAHDDFNTPAGALHAKATGSGWGGAWFTQNTDATVPGYAVAGSSQLQYGGLVTSGNYATGGLAYLTTGRAFDVSASGPFAPYLTGGNIGASGTTVYMSALVRKQNNNGDDVHITLHPNALAWHANTPLVAMGYFGTASDNGGSRYWSLRIGSTVYRTNKIITPGQAALLVVRIQFASTNTVSLFVNPANLGGSAPATADASGTTTTNLGFKSIAYYGGNGPNQSALDEIRLGDSFGAVTPTGSGGDTQPPTAPSNLASTGRTSTTVSLSWSASTDNVGVSDYQVYNGGNFVNSTSATTYTVTGLAPNTPYTFTVRAQDAADNTSPASNAVNVTTLSAGGSGDATITLDANTQHQTMDGFGFFGGKDVWWGSGDPTHFYSNAWLDRVIGDLGISIWRNELYPHNPPDQHTLNDQDADWNKQRPMIEALKAKADQYGVDLKVILTVWSPPGAYKWWSQFAWPGDEAALRGPSGDGDYWWEKNGGTLNPNKYTDFANWLGDGIQMYKDIGIDVYAISPQNEPAFTQSFNSCTYTTQWYVDMVKAVAPIVKNRHPGIKFFGSENMLEMEGADENWQWFYTNKLKGDALAMNQVDILAYHGYSDGVNASSGSNLARYWENTWNIFAQPAGKKQWMTETSGYVDTWEPSADKPGAFNLAMDIYSALRYGNVSGWVWWQGSEQTSSIGEFALMTDTQIGKKYHASKQYYKFIRPNAVRMGANSSDTSIYVLAFRNTSIGTNSVVLLNSNTGNKTVSLSSIGSGWPTGYEMFVTSASQNCVSVGNVSASSLITLPPRSIVTLQAGGTSQLRAPTVASALKASVFPNPARGSVNINLDAMDGEKAMVQLVDFMKQPVLTEEYDLHAGENTIALNTSAVKEGVYILTIKQSNKTTQTKLVIGK